MIIEYNGYRPQIAENVFIAPTAVIIGNVKIEAGASIWYGAVLRGDEGEIRIGRGSNVQDNCVIHTTTQYPTIIEEDVTIGHAAKLEGCIVKRGSVIGTGSVVLNRAIVGEGSMVAAGSVVGEGMEIPAGHLAAGVPAAVKKPLSDQAKRWVEISAEAYYHLRDSYLRQKLGDPSAFSS